MQDVPTFGGWQRTSKINNAKAPKARPPRGIRDHVLFPGRSLPTYTGPYPVGTMEIEVPVREPRHFSHIKRDGRYLLRLETVLMTVYYPVSHKDHGLQKNDKRFSRELWLGRPRLGVAEGYGTFGGVGPAAIPLFASTMLTKLPAFRNAPIARYWAPEVDTKKRGLKVKVEKGCRPPGAPEEPVFPFIMFSHGLGGTRTMYSSVCGEFASYGFVVCAVEHRDGSGPRTYVNHPKKPWPKNNAPDGENPIQHTAQEEKQGWHNVDYVFPKDNPNDTSPNNKKGVDRELRDAQIDLRLAELEEAYEVMCELERGNGQLVADQNLRCEGHKGSSRKGLKGVNWSRWKGRFQTQNVTICGHSFGAATAVEVLRHDDRFKYVSQGIIYDIWGAVVKNSQDSTPEHRIHAPIIAINSEAFTYWASNFNLVTSLIEEAQLEPKPAPAWMMTLRGTVHVSQSDFSLLYPNVCSLLLKAVANPRRALDLNINASLEFLAHVLPGELAQVNRAYHNENLLEHELSPLSRIPSLELARPDEKSVALKLKVPHEWAFRLSPKLFQKLQARDNGGSKPEFNEVWLHMKPTEDILYEHLRKTPGRSPNKDEDYDAGIGLKSGTTLPANSDEQQPKSPPQSESKDWTSSANDGACQQAIPGLAMNNDEESGSQSKSIGSSMS